jgi:hypothetical protein
MRQRHRQTMTSCQDSINASVCALDVAQNSQNAAGRFLLPFNAVSALE